MISHAPIHPKLRLNRPPNTHNPRNPLVYPPLVLTSSDMLSKLMDVHADAQAPRDATSTIASRKSRGLSTEAKVRS